MDLILILLYHPHFSAHSRKYACEDSDNRNKVAIQDVLSNSVLSFFVKDKRKLNNTICSEDDQYHEEAIKNRRNFLFNAEGLDRTENNVILAAATSLILSTPDRKQKRNLGISKNRCLVGAGYQNME